MVMVVDDGCWHWMGELLDWEVVHDFWMLGYCLDGALELGWYNLGFRMLS